MKIFITGGTGFIGTHLVKKLKEKKYDLRILKTNLANQEEWKKEIHSFEPDCVVHLAWEGLPDYSKEQNQKNFNYSKSLFDFLKTIKCERVFSTGSAWEIQSGFSKEGFMMMQSPPPSTNDFSQTKKRIQLMGESMFEKFVWARIHFVYGPGQRETSLIPYLINCAKKDETPEIKKPRDVNDYIYIDDVAKALTVLLDKAEQKSEYDICSGKFTPTQKIVKIVADQLGKKNWPEEKDFPNGKIMENNMNAKLKLLGWQPEIDLEDGIKKTIDFYWNKK